MKQILLGHALKLAAKKGFRNVTRLDIATAASVATGTVTYHLGDMPKVQRAIVAHAIEEMNLDVLAQALAEKHPLAVGAPNELKKAAARRMTRTG